MRQREREKKPYAEVEKETPSASPAMLATLYYKRLSDHNRNVNMLPFVLHISLDNIHSLISLLIPVCVSATNK